jgi:hypothetical protein
VEADGRSDLDERLSRTSVLEGLMLSILPVLFAALFGGPVVERAHALAPIVVRPATASVDALLTASDRRIRALHPNVVKLVADGTRRSKTFLSLMRAVDATDIIVYIEASHDLPASLAGRMLIVPSTGPQRFMRIQVRIDTRPDDIIATIAHELRHVLEVAADLTVRDVHALASLYKRIGNPVPGGQRYDTVAAQDAGRTVRLELQG